jgi:serine protease AprX
MSVGSAGLAAPAFAVTTVVDTGSLSSISQITGAQAMWNQGFAGQGVGVAVIDTGVARVPGLNAPGKVIDGPDLSLDSQDPGLARTDAFGHGTHIAGIIAGSDVPAGSSALGCATCVGRSAYTDTTKFVGIAPEAKIINVKVGAYDGAVDVSQVIAGINWIVQHRNDPGLNIRVINLSFGTDSLHSADVDPLAYAAQVAWNAGIVVVAAGGNDGAVVGPLADPALSSSILAVGATDPMGTLRTTDDLVATFAQHGTSARPVDVAAPGVGVISLRVPNGFVDQNVTTGKVGTRFQRASGTSQATAVVSGLAALLLSKYPTATPDMVKSYLMSVADAMPVQARNKPEFTGRGSASVSRAATDSSFTAAAAMTAVAPRPATGTGTGTLEAARGTFHLTSSSGVPLVGETDIFGKKWNSASIATLTKARIGWTGGVWNSSTWIGSTWTGLTWPTISWTNTDWTGARWSGARWSDLIWDGARWSDATWSGARWSDATWSGARWSDSTWTGARWSGARWSDAGWS